jgi:hypothetical protein
MKSTQWSGWSPNFQKATTSAEGFVVVGVKGRIMWPLKPLQEK